MNKQKEKKYIIDPHKLDKRLKYAERRVLSSKICERNKELILKYRDYIVLEEKLSKSRVEKWLNTLVPLADMLGKPFDEADIEGIKGLVKKILERDYSENTKVDFQRMLKKFYKWIRGTGEEYPPEVKWIKAKRPPRKPLSNKDVISWEDVVKMSQHCMNPRDKAFIKTLWETGNRINEHLTLTIGDVEELEYGVSLNINHSKTDLRDGFIWLSVPDLLAWIESHPKAEDKDAPLWIRIDGRKDNECMSYDYVRKLLKKLGSRAGIKKKLNPHNFRHGSTSFWSDHLSDSQMKYKFGWAMSSKMLDTYVHKDSKVIREKVLKLAGVDTGNDENSVFNIETAKCHFCGKENGTGRKVCFNCKRMLEPEESRTAQRLRDTIDDSIVEFSRQSPEFLNSYMEFMRRKTNSSSESAF